MRITLQCQRSPCLETHFATELHNAHSLPVTPRHEEMPQALRNCSRRVAKTLPMIGVAWTAVASIWVPPATSVRMAAMPIIPSCCPNHALRYHANNIVETYREPFRVSQHSSAHKPTRKRRRSHRHVCASPFVPAPVVQQPLLAVIAYGMEQVHKARASSRLTDQNSTRRCCSSPAAPVPHPRRQPQTLSARFAVMRPCATHQLHALQPL